MDKKTARIIFMGTPDFSVEILKSLTEHYDVKAVVTQPDRVVGRKGELAKPPVKIFIPKSPGSAT